jgi:hypothetical protein
MVADVPLQDLFEERRAIYPRKNAAIAFLLFPDDGEGRFWDRGISKVAQRR